MKAGEHQAADFLESLKNKRTRVVRFFFFDARSQNFLSVNFFSARLCRVLSSLRRRRRRRNALELISTWNAASVSWSRTFSMLRSPSSLTKHRFDASEREATRSSSPQCCFFSVLESDLRSRKKNISAIIFFLEWIIKLAISSMIRTASASPAMDRRTSSSSTRRRPSQQRSVLPRFVLWQFVQKKFAKLPLCQIFLNFAPF